MYLRKQVTQLPSKMRFVAAQFLALLDDDRWLELAGHANAMAGALHAAVAGLPGRRCRAARRSTACSPSCRPTSSSRSSDWCFFWDWDASRHQVRWMTAWDTTDDDVERFAAGVTAAD